MRFKIQRNKTRKARGLKPDPLRLLLLGTAGTGKTVTIAAGVNKCLEDDLIVRLTGTTGKVSVALEGETIHRLLTLPIGRNNRGQLKGKGLSRLQEALKGTDAVVLDEFSMLSQSQWSYVNRRLSQANPRSDEFFGGMNLVMVGDLAQLPPVTGRVAWKWKPEKPDDCQGKEAYESFQDVVCLTHESPPMKLTLYFIRELCTTGTIQLTLHSRITGTSSLFFGNIIINPWMSKLLSENDCQLHRWTQVFRQGQGKTAEERQRKKEFRELLMALREGEMTEKHHRLLKTRMPLMDGGVTEQYADNFRKTAIGLFPLRDDVAEENATRLLRLRATDPERHAIARIDAEHSDKAARNASVKQAQNLQPELFLSVGARVMLVNNKSVEHGLCNGATGVVTDIKWSDGPQGAVNQRTARGGLALPKCTLVFFQSVRHNITRVL